MKRYIVMVMALCMLFACQTQKMDFNLEKEGLIYNYNEVISFYYPRDWVVVKDELKLSLDISNEGQKEALYFDTFDTEGSNTPIELMSLYESRLLNVGVEIISQQEDTLQNGQQCFYVQGEISKKQLSFCEVIVFVGNKQYIYSYIANQDVYESNQENMLRYLKSLVVNEAMKTAI